MSTKTMRLPPRRFSMPTESNNKRKQRESNSFELPKQAKSKPAQTGSDPVPDNKILAGYLAHEFFNNGSIFGRAFEPARSTSSLAEPSEPKEDKTQRYVDVTRLLVNKDGAHLPGIVNPTQLARLLQL